MAEIEPLCTRNVSSNYFCGIVRFRDRYYFSITRLPWDIGFSESGNFSSEDQTSLPTVPTDIIRLSAALVYVFVVRSVVMLSYSVAMIITPFLHIQTKQKTKNTKGKMTKELVSKHSKSNNKTGTTRLRRILKHFIDTFSSDKDNLKKSAFKEHVRFFFL